MFWLVILLSLASVILLGAWLQQRRQTQKLRTQENELNIHLSYYRNLAALVDSSKEMLGIITPAGNFIYMNESLTTALGVTAPWSEPISIAQVFNTESAKFSSEKWLNMAKNKGYVHTNSEMITWEQNQLLPVDITVFTLNSQQADANLGITIRDITGEVHYMEVRKKHEQQLENLVQQRTQELAEVNQQVVKELHERRYLESRLAKTQKLEAMGQLSAGIAHEINNPINFVNMNLDALALYVNEMFAGAEPPTAERLEYLRTDTQELLQESKAGINKITEIVRGLRSFAQPESGERAPLNLRDLLEEALQMVRGQIKHHQVECDWGEVPPVWGSGVQLSQVFVNVLLNGIAAMKEPGVLTVTTSFHENQAVVQIKDTGVGIAEDVGNKLFDPFYTTKAVGEGTGLGLYISYGIIKEHGGEMSYWKRVGPGTTFRMALPVDLRSRR